MTSHLSFHKIISGCRAQNCAPTKLDCVTASKQSSKIWFLCTLQVLDARGMIPEISHASSNFNDACLIYFRIHPLPANQRINREEE